MHDVSFRMFFSSLEVTQVCLSQSLTFEHLDPLTTLGFYFKDIG